jgi:hypothetical protein
LFTADVVGQFLTLGGNAAFLYGDEPSLPMHEGSACAGYGQMMLFEANERGQALWPMPTYFAARLITHEWTKPGNQSHKLYPTSSDIHDGSGRAIVSAYAVRRPDGKWSIMLVNKDRQHDHLVRINFKDGGSVWHFSGNVAGYHYSSAQYAWKESGENGHPLRSQPPQYFRLRSSQPVRLPAFSLSVVRGKFSAGHLRSTNNTSNRPAVPKEGLDDSRCPASLASQESLASDQGPFDQGADQQDPRHQPGHRACQQESS